MTQLDPPKPRFRRRTLMSALAGLLGLALTHDAVGGQDVADRSLAALAGTGLDLGQRINIASTLTGYATTHASLAHSMTTTATTLAAGDGAITGLADYGDILGQVLDPEDYPELTAAVRSHAFGTAEEWIDDADFTFGLDLLLDGIQTLITRRG